MGVSSRRLDVHLPDVDGAFAVTFQCRTTDCFCPTVSEREPQSTRSIYFSSCNSKTNKVTIRIYFCETALVNRALKILGKSLPFTVEISASAGGPTLIHYRWLLCVSFHQDGPVIA